MMIEPNTKRKLISRKLVDVSSLVAELRSKNPYNPKKEPYCDMSWNTCCDELEKMLKEERK